MEKTKKLSVRLEKFCQEYLFDGNATQAMKRAGYVGKNVTKTAYKMLQKPEVQAYLEELRAAMREKYQVSNEKVIRELAIVAFSDISDYLDENNELVDIGKMNPAMRRAISSMRRYKEEEVKRSGLRAMIKLHDKIAALAQLFKVLDLSNGNNDMENCVKQIIIIPDSMHEETVEKRVEENEAENVRDTVTK